jgi:hypothetical protein
MHHFLNYKQSFSFCKNYYLSVYLYSTFSQNYYYLSVYAQNYSQILCCKLITIIYNFIFCLFMHNIINSIIIPYLFYTIPNTILVKTIYCCASNPLLVYGQKLLSIAMQAGTRHNKQPAAHTRKWQACTPGST